MGKRKILLVLFAILSVILTVSAQKKKTLNTRSVETGLVSVIIPPLLDEKNTPLVGYDEPEFRVFLKKQKLLKEIPFQTGGKYEISVPKGVYRIILKNLEGKPVNYQRANFYVTPQQVIKINIPLYESVEVCDAQEGFVILSKIISFSENKGEKKEQDVFSKPKYESYKIDSLFQATIKYCQKTETSQFITYNFARLTYKTFLLEARNIVLDKKKQLFTGKGDKENPASSIYNGESLEKETINFDLITEKILALDKIVGQRINLSANVIGGTPSTEMVKKKWNDNWLCFLHFLILFPTRTPTDFCNSNLNVI